MRVICVNLGHLAPTKDPLYIHIGGVYTPIRRLTHEDIQPFVSYRVGEGDYYEFLEDIGHAHHVDHFREILPAEEEELQNQLIEAI